MEEKKVKQYTNLSMVVFFALIILGCILALTLYQVLYVQTYVDINIYVFDVIVLALGYFVSVSLYYLGKYIFGLISGYRLINFNFWFINFIKDKNNKTQVKPCKLHNLGCRVIMAPNNAKPNYKLYLFGGTIFTMPICLIAIIVSLFLHVEDDFKYYLLFIFAFIPFVCLGNLIPVRLDGNNEGFTLRLLKDENQVEIYHRNLLQHEALVNGRSELKYYECRTPVTPFDLDTLYYNYYYCIDNQEFLKALRISEELIKNSDAITDLSRVYLGYTGKIYELCRQKRFEESDRFFWELKHDIRNVVRNKNNFESIKICLFVAAYMETNYDEYLNLYYRKEKASKQYEYTSRIEKEVEIINQTIKSIQTDHSDWYVE